MAKLHAQDAASRSALTGSFTSEDSFVHIYSSDPNQNLDLVITRKRKPIAQLIPGMTSIIGRSLVTDVAGIAIVENQR